MRNKKCKKCEITHPIENFDWSHKAQGYYKSYCRICSLDIYQDWKALNKFRDDENRKQYYIDNPTAYGRTGKPIGRPKNEELKSGVYLLTNNTTGETYVGCSSDVKRRIWRHFYNRGRSKSKSLAKAFKQHGQEAFTSQVLEYCEKSQIFIRELEHMKNYKCEYNRNKKQNDTNI